MKAVTVMFDTLSRRYLSTYGNDWVPTPNFKRLEEKCTVFDKYYVGSLPCMPARREMHTGRYNFLHRGWGPLEPFDDSAISMLNAHGIYTHIVTDHDHYWEDGGATYVQRFSSWEGFRGQESDKWAPFLAPETLDIPKMSEHMRQGPMIPVQFANRRRMPEEEQMSGPQTILAGIDFLEKYHEKDNWYLQIECFDPHEPFNVPQRFIDMVGDDYTGDFFDWPSYRMTIETPEECAHLVKLYGALIAMCDEYLGKVIDAFDKYDLWKDTALIVNTDHGFLTGEHDWWGKNRQPQYDEIAHIPHYLYVPGADLPKRTDLLCQTIDFAPTLLDLFGIEPTERMLGKSILKALQEGEEIREAGLYGMFGGQVAVVTEDAVYMRTPDPACDIRSYTLMPTNMIGFFQDEILKTAALDDTLSFTKGIPVLAYTQKPMPYFDYDGNMLFDMQADPKQEHNLVGEADDLEQEMLDHLRRLLTENEADDCQFRRLGLEKD